jgi:KDO2-lipid IV(A) lauroyltransferase
MTPRELRSIVELDGLEHLVEAISRARGVIILSAHIGNWDMLAAALSDSGVPLSVIGRKPADPVLADRLERIRQRWGVETLWRERGARPILRALANGRAVGALIDQATRVESVQVPFFGHEAWTPVGPAQIALRTKVPVIPVHMTHRRNDSTRYVGVVEPDIPSAGETPTSLTAIWTERIEKWVRDAPETWVWMHDRWRDNGTHEHSRKGVIT